MPKEKIAGVGLVVTIQDTEGNVIGLWKPAKKPVIRLLFRLPAGGCSLIHSGIPQK